MPDPSTAPSAAPRRRTPLVPVVTGFAAAVPYYVLLLKHPDGAYDLLTLILAFTGGIYYGVALREGSRRRLIGEALAGGALTLVAALALWWTPLWLALGFTAHGLWNLAHHTGAVKHGIRHWFPPMHAAWEWAIAALVVYFTGF
ncbi:MAG TPA: hypothetical protein VF142_19960 [Longimicrobium sp.]